jgi:DNA-binding transcriptional LysR family regulator
MIFRITDEHGPVRNLDVSLIRAFAAVAETGGMTSAGNALHLTQAAVSQQIKRLEETFGSELFARDRRGLTLTEAGERLLGPAKRMLALNDEIWAEMTAKVFTGQVRLGVPYDLVGSYLPNALRIFARANPQVEITLVNRGSPRLKAALLAGEIDLAVVEEAGTGSDCELLATDRLVWVGARGGEAHLKRPLPVASCESCAFRPVLFERLRDANIPFRIVTEGAELDSMSATVQTDLAVAGALMSTVAPGATVLGSSSGLPDLPAFSINLYLPSGGGSELARLLAEDLRAAFLNRLRTAA